MNQEWIIYEQNKPKVRHDLEDGRIDYIDLTSWSFMDRFFAFLISSEFFEWAGTSYPTARRKHEIPVWFLISCVIQMKLHTTAIFHNLKGILKSGAIMTRVGFNIGLKGGGFNYKNKKPRETPVDQDTIRKYFKDTDPDKLMAWFNQDVVGWFRRHRGFDKDGIFIWDGTILPLPNNPNYERAGRLPLDEEGNYIEMSKLSDEERKKIKYTNCYSLTSLLHLSPSADYFLYAGCHLGPGTKSPLKAGEKLVDDFVDKFGKGVIKLLIGDRGFIDGAMTTRFKKEYKIDLMVPLRSNMAALEEARFLAEMPEAKWDVYAVEKDKDGNILKKEEITAVRDITLWDNCKVPLYVALMRRTDKNGEVEYWGLASTRFFKYPGEAFDLYHKRSQIEERHKQLKLCWLLYAFSSPKFSLVTTHVVFVLLVYSLIQLYLKRKHLSDLANKTITTLRSEERLGKDAVIVYSRENFAVFDLDEYTDIIMKLEEAPRQRLRSWIKEFRKRKKQRGPP